MKMLLCFRRQSRGTTPGELRTAMLRCQGNSVFSGGTKYMLPDIKQGHLSCVLELVVSSAWLTAPTPSLTAPNPIPHSSMRREHHVGPYCTVPTRHAVSAHTTDQQRKHNLS